MFGCVVSDAGFHFFDVVFVVKEVIGNSEGGAFRLLEISGVYVNIYG